MADIHILKTPKSGSERRVNVLYHVPIDNARYPGGETSQIEEALDQSEIDALDDGSLREVSKTFRFSEGIQEADMTEQIRAKWQDIADDEQARIDNEYEYYHATLERS